MKEIIGNMWDIKSEYKCITTNGYIKSNGEAVMGRGVALQAKNKFPELPRILGKHIRENGNRPGLLIYTGQYSIFSFPVKHHWKEKADLDLIIKSSQYMMDEADRFRAESILLPKPGCGNGQLDWEVIKILLKDILDDRFTIIDWR